MSYFHFYHLFHTKLHFKITFTCYYLSRFCINLGKPCICSLMIIILLLQCITCKRYFYTLYRLFFSRFNEYWYFESDRWHIVCWFKSKWQLFNRELCHSIDLSFVWTAGRTKMQHKWFTTLVQHILLRRLSGGKHILLI